MKLENLVDPYLKGEAFHNQLPVRIARKQPLSNRIDYLCNYAAGKKIIHVGCVDHLPLIDEKINSGTWLYKRLEAVAMQQFGVDLNEEGIDYMRNNLGFKNVAAVNLLEGDIHPEIKKQKWDAMVLGEILEHVENPVEFLSGLKRRYEGLVNEIIITVPNAFAINNTVASFVNIEIINTDHYYWFSPYTLTRILIASGFTPLYFDFATYYPLKKKMNPLKKLAITYLLKRNPAFRADLIYAAKFTNTPQQPLHCEGRFMTVASS